MSRFLHFAAILLLPVCFAVPAFAKPPAWVTTLASKPASMKYGDASHAVLLDEVDLVLDKNGVITKRTRFAIRVITKDGRDDAVAQLAYDTSLDRVKSFQAWLIPATGTPIDYGKKHTVDVASFSNARELYGEARELIISAKDTATPGAVFAYEAVTTENSIYTQDLWFFQQSVPVEYSGINLTLPDGWTVRSLTFNRDPIVPVTNGKTQTWSLSNLPAFTAEPLGPPRHSLAPWIALDFVPPAGAATNRVSFSSWQAVSEYFTPHYETSSTPDAAIKARVEALVAGATTQRERITRLCRFAQSVNYISINLNAATAGGMIPRPAARVFQCNYGDCKDKSSLLRSLLRTQGIVAHPVIVYSGDSTRVRPEWASPFQFNHCIIAIAIDDSFEDAPGVLIHPVLGRLLFFDPTNETTPPGWLAQEDLDGHGLVLAGSKGQLVRLPASRPQDDRVERIITARLDPFGAIAGTITEHFDGYASNTVRDERQPLSASDYRTKIVEPWLGRTLPSARVTQLDATDDFAAAHLDLTIGFEAHSYGKMMRDTLLVFKPVIVARRDGVSLKRGKRTQPIVITPSSFTEKTEIELPAGYAVDESFPAADIQSPFGHYRASAEVRDGRLHFQRSRELRAATLPPDQFETARAFFEKILQAEQSPVVLRRL
ncbi:MAG: DUF3857 domain-containing protein [Nibricoccus sp.]